MSNITENKFNKLFVGSAKENHKFRITKKINNISDVSFDKIRQIVTIYELGDLSENKNYNVPKGTMGMLEKFRTNNLEELTEYLNGGLKCKEKHTH